MSDPKGTFEAAAKGGRTSVVRQVLRFIFLEGKYWWLPFVIVLVGLAALATLGGTAAAPFIYTLF